MTPTNPLARAAARAIPAAIVTLALAASAGAVEPDLRVEAGIGDDVIVRLLPHPALPDPAEFNLYRGALADLGTDVQRGDPDGRCAIPGSDSDVVLAGERAIPGDFYYLLTAVPAAGPETGLGTRSDGIARMNTFPCPAAA